MQTITIPPSNIIANFSFKVSVYTVLEQPVKLQNNVLCRLSTHLQAGVEAPCLLLFLFWCWIQPHKAIIPEYDGCTTWQVVEMCFLPLDQRRRELHQHSLSQLIVRESRNRILGQIGKRQQSTSSLF